MSFDVSVTLPFDNIHAPEEFISLDALREISQTAERAGFSAGAVTDHEAAVDGGPRRGGEDERALVHGGESGVGVGSRAAECHRAAAGFGERVVAADHAREFHPRRVR